MMKIEGKIENTFLE